MSLTWDLVSCIHLTEREQTNNKMKESFWGQVTTNPDIENSQSLSILTVIVRIEVATSVPLLACVRLQVGYFWCRLFILPTTHFDTEMSRELVGGRVERKSWSFRLTLQNLSKASHITRRKMKSTILHCWTNLIYLGF